VVHRQLADQGSELAGDDRSGIAVEDGSVPVDEERLAKDEVPQLGERRQLVGWNSDAVAFVAGVRSQFVHAAGDETACLE
jgi:hypothetical protein